jgi:hypothetical protein
MVKCQKCQTGEALWARQELETGHPCFTLLGSHYRGWTVVKVCTACKTLEQSYLKTKEAPRRCHPNNRGGPQTTQADGLATPRPFHTNKEERT